MKDKVLFAKTGIAKFMVLLVTLLTMFGSCNFVGGSDARTVDIGAFGTPPKTMDDTYCGLFKSPMEVAIEPVPWEQNYSPDPKPVTCTIILPRIIPIALDNWWGGAINVYGDKEIDVSGVTSVKFDLVATKDTSVYVNVYGKANDDEENPKDLEYIEHFHLRPYVTESHTIGNFPEVKDGVGTFFYIGGDGTLKGGAVKITNFAFYDKNGNEVVPKVKN